MSRFSEAISEGDGISVIPILEGEVADLAKVADEAGAEAIAVTSVEEAKEARSRTTLPIIVRNLVRSVEELRAIRSADADACSLVVEELGRPELLEDLYGEAMRLGLDCALDVHDEDELEAALERIDPEILILSEREPEKDEEELMRTLELLPDVPAGKLVISESRVSAREQVLALEGAGVDGVLLAGGSPQSDFAALVAELSGR